MFTYKCYDLPLNDLRWELHLAVSVTKEWALSPRGKKTIRRAVFKCLENSQRPFHLMYGRELDALDPNEFGLRTDKKCPICFPDSTNVWYCVVNNNAGTEMIRSVHNSESDAIEQRDLLNQKHVRADMVIETVYSLERPIAGMSTDDYRRI